MSTFVDSAAVKRGRGDDGCLDPQLWHACAGGMVQMPPVGSKVYYFPQGHAEHTQRQAGPVEFSPPGAGRVPALDLCRVAAVRFMADPDTDEVFAKIRLVPARPQDAGDADDAIAAAAGQEDKPASFAKTLTQADANNGGGFSVPRFCAETIFPRLDYSADPPVQTVLAKDVHGVVWKFRHIYRGTPRRHLLTTGWSSFVNQKKLVAGDSIVFMRTENGNLCVGFRRAKKGGIGGPDLPPPPPPGGNYGGFSMYLRAEEDGNNNKMMGARGNKSRVRVRPEEVAEAANLAVSGQPFDVLYYPRAGTPEFCVKAAAVRAAMRTQWCPGMRFKMAFETEDSSRISWFMGTVSAVQVVDPIRWPDSPWRLLQVSWDEPDLLQNVKKVSPWLVELVSNMPAIHLAPFSPPRKKLCVPFYKFYQDGPGESTIPSKSSMNSTASSGLAESSGSTCSNTYLSATEPMAMTFQELHRMTDGFSKTKLLGTGGFGSVYKGVFDNGKVIAVKKLQNNPGLVEDQFKNELLNLMTVQHQNIIRLVGYCSEAHQIVVEHEGKRTLINQEERALCLEYMQGGTLEELLSDESCRLDWDARYKIIKGICQGLMYLHTGSKDPIYHLDLKPANILLDENHVPKIGDFGLSRLLASTATLITLTNSGTLGYMPPEYMHGRKITSKFDVFSLGVIIVEIIAGPEGHYNYKCVYGSPQEFIDHVIENWNNRVQEKTMSTEALLQVKKCIKIALRCVEDNRAKRPTITEIVAELDMIDLHPGPFGADVGDDTIPAVLEQV